MNSILFGVIDATVRYEKLTKMIIHRLPSAIQFAGRYRLIDFNLSSLKNSGIRNVAIFPNGNYRSLTDHVSSGQIWDLDRKRDGLFILPPKMIIEQSDDMISFNRMKEHMEYFLRSKQSYVVLTSGVIIWNINFLEPLKQHIDCGADITEIVTDNQLLNTYILKKDDLIQFILQHEYLGFHNLKELTKFAQNLKINYYTHKGYTKMITSIRDLFDSNMDMLDLNIEKEIFTINHPILSKIKDSPPTYYGDKALISDTIVANGAKINGNISHSVISRNVIVEEGAIIKNSIIMQQSYVMANAMLDYCIIDKDVIIGENVVLKGSKENPIIIEKAEKLVNKSQINVLHAATECAPFVKTGGLGDVIAALPNKQRELGHIVGVCLPLYEQIIENYQEVLHLEYTIPIDDFKVYVYTLNREGVRYHFFKIKNYFEKKRLYSYANDLIRYYYFNVAIIHLLNYLEYPPDIIHLHDYHVSLIPVLLKKRYANLNIKTCLTIHNLTYQGIYTNLTFIEDNLNDITKSDTINFLKLGLTYADVITTVSPTYSQEIQYEYFSENLLDVISKRKASIIGILNGLDDEIFNPKTDKLITKNYDFLTIENKKINKVYLQQTSNLIVDDEIPIIGMVTRLVEQKGLDLVIAIFDELMKSEKVEFVLLGTGNKKYEDKFKEYEAKYPQFVKANIGYNSFNPNQIYAGIDFFLMPSRYEPCGLGQMIALKYGSIPIVRETGGLKDTVIPYDAFTKNGNGFSFQNYNALDMLHTIKRAINFFHKKEDWLNIIYCGMKSDFSYEKTAIKYNQLYENLLQ